jgi:hypothetical protein
MKMIAMKTVYDRAARKEYRPGVEFEVSDDNEANRLERTRKAKRAPVKPAHVDLPKAMKEEEHAAPKKSGGRGRYQRRDMVATDGPTGEEIPLPSLPADPQPSEETSDSSEEESAS